MRPGIPNPAQYEAAIRQMESGRSQIDSEISKREQALSQLKAQKEQFLSVVNNPQVPEAQKGQYRAALAKINEQIEMVKMSIAEYKRQKEQLQGNINTYRVALMRIASAKAQQQQAVHAESSMNRG